jgi:hypothetical protein
MRVSFQNECGMWQRAPDHHHRGAKAKPNVNGAGTE